CLRGTAAGAKVVGVVLRGGGHASRGAGRWNVPRGEVVGVLRLMMEKGDLTAAQGMRGREELQDELGAFLERGKESRDDLVMALGLACWWGRRGV
ncbi:MAG TPA: hypothetical protein DEH78_01930, partial [Solibacterales bacterium]|nr:hypothetical protein [Bryobacterales bacterium]